MRIAAQNQQRDHMTVLLDSFIPQKCLFRLTPLHRGSFGMLPKKAGLQTFLHSQAPSQTFFPTPLLSEEGQGWFNGVYA